MSFIEMVHYWVLRRAIFSTAQTQHYVTIAYFTNGCVGQ